MKFLTNALLVSIFGVMALLVGCDANEEEEKGTMEQMGQQMDETWEETKEAADSMGDDTEEMEETEKTEEQ